MLTEPASGSPPPAEIPSESAACPHCGLSSTYAPLPEGTQARCPRCKCRIELHPRGGFQRPLAYSGAALLLLGLSLAFPFMSFNANGREQTMTLFAASWQLLRDGQPHLALFVFTFTIGAPAALLTAIAWLHLPLVLGRRDPAFPALAKIVFGAAPWAMADVFIIGVLISLTKIASMATVTLETSFWAYAAFAILFTATVSGLDKRRAWRAFDPSRVPVKPKPDRRTSLHRCMAYLVTSIILFIPANTLPIMDSVEFGRGETNTIVSGVIMLWEHGSFVIASIIFLASIMVPISKILSLAYLCWTARAPKPNGRPSRSAAYRVTELIGRWSMIDIFVVAVLTALVRLDRIMSIQAGPAAFAFCGVVVFTMLAAHAFDPRLIWETYPTRNDRTTR